MSVTMMIDKTNIQLLATIVDSNNEEESEYRFLVDEEYVKYITVGPGVFPKKKMIAPLHPCTLRCCQPSLPVSRTRVTFP